MTHARASLGPNCVQTFNNEFIANKVFRVDKELPKWCQMVTILERKIQPQTQSIVSLIINRKFSTFIKSPWFIYQHA